MPETVVAAPVTTDRRATARITRDGARFDLWVESPTHPVSGSADGFAIAALVPAMTLGGRLVVEAPVSPRLLGNLQRAQSVLTSWLPQLRRVEIRADASVSTLERAVGIGSFMSLGTDSFYTLKRKHMEVTHLVTIKGYEALPLSDDVWARIFANARDVARRHDKTLVEVSTNVRAFTVPGLTWRWLHGPALAAIAHQLDATIGRVYVSASQTIGHTLPWGTHPALDPLWSGDRLELRHFGGDATRVEKTRQIAELGGVRESLRVCLKPDDVYNCGRCSKCLTAMLVLRSLGVLRECPTFPALERDALRRVDLTQGTRAKNLRDARDLLRRSGRDPALVRAVTRALWLTRLKRVKQHATGPLTRTGRDTGMARG